jgi:hypothetical protein
MMIMLTNYANNLFATRSTLNEALVQANDIYGKAMSSADSIAMRTAVHIVLNTAIQLHTFEMDALRDKHAADMRALVATRHDPVTALLMLVEEQVKTALDERMDNVFAERFDAAVESWADDKLDDRIGTWYDDNVDLKNAVEEVLEKEVELDDMVHEKVKEFFGNNTFSLDPR